LRPLAGARLGRGGQINPSWRALAVAQDLHVSIAACGQFVTVFAFAYGLAGPPLVDARLGFAAANLLAAIASSYAVLVAARLLAAMMAALLMAPSVAAAVGLSPPAKKGKVISRDRGGGYGEAAARAPPAATQVADRWHLMENASAAFLDAVRKSMRAIRGATDATPRRARGKARARQINHKVRHAPPTRPRD